MSYVDGSPWFTVDEAAGVLRMHPVTLRKHLSAGTITGHQFTEPKGRWRIHRDDLEAFMAPAPRRANLRSA